MMSEEMQFDFRQVWSKTITENQDLQRLYGLNEGGVKIEHNQQNPAQLVIFSAQLLRVIDLSKQVPLISQIQYLSDKQIVRAGFSTGYLVIVITDSKVPNKYVIELRKISKIGNSCDFTTTIIDELIDSLPQIASFDGLDYLLTTSIDGKQKKLRIQTIRKGKLYESVLLKSDCAFRRVDVLLNQWVLFNFNDTSLGLIDFKSLKDGYTWESILYNPSMVIFDLVNDNRAFKIDNVDARLVQLQNSTYLLRLLVNKSSAALDLVDIFTIKLDQQGITQQGQIFFDGEIQFNRGSVDTALAQSSLINEGSIRNYHRLKDMVILNDHSVFLSIHDRQLVLTVYSLPERRIIHQTWSVDESLTDDLATIVLNRSLIKADQGLQVSAYSISKFATLVKKLQLLTMDDYNKIALAQQSNLNLIQSLQDKRKSRTNASFIDTAGVEESEPEQLINEYIINGLWSKLSKLVMMKTLNSQSAYFLTYTGLTFDLLKIALENQKGQLLEVLKMVKYYQNSYQIQKDYQDQINYSRPYYVKLEILQRLEHLNVQCEGIISVMNTILKRQVQVSKTNQAFDQRSQEDTNIKKFKIENAEKQSNLIKILTFMVKSDYLPIIKQNSHDILMMIEGKENNRLNSDSFIYKLLEFTKIYNKKMPVIDIQDIVQMLDMAVLPTQPLQVIFYYLIDLYELYKIDLIVQFNLHLQHLLSLKQQRAVRALWILDRSELHEIKEENITQSLSDFLACDELSYLQLHVLKKIVSMRDYTSLGPLYIKMGGCRDYMNSPEVLRNILEIYANQEQYHEFIDILKINENIINDTVYQIIMKEYVSKVIDSINCMNNLFTVPFTRKQEQIVIHQLQGTELYVSYQAFKKRMVPALAEGMLLSFKEDSHVGPLKKQQVCPELIKLREPLVFSYLGTLHKSTQQSIYKSTKIKSDEADLFIQEKKTKLRADISMRKSMGQNKSILGDGLSQKIQPVNDKCDEKALKYLEDPFGHQRFLNLGSEAEENLMSFFGMEGVAQPEGNQIMMDIELGEEDSKRLDDFFAPKKTQKEKKDFGIGIWKSNENLNYQEPVEVVNIPRLFHGELANLDGYEPSEQIMEEEEERQSIERESIQIEEEQKFDQFRQERSISDKLQINELHSEQEENLLSSPVLGPGLSKEEPFQEEDEVMLQEVEQSPEQTESQEEINLRLVAKDSTGKWKRTSARLERVNSSGQKIIEEEEEEEQSEVYEYDEEEEDIESIEGESEEARQARRERLIMMRNQTAGIRRSRKHTPVMNEKRSVTRQYAKEKNIKDEDLLPQLPSETRKPPQ